LGRADAAAAEARVRASARWAQTFARTTCAVGGRNYGTDVRLRHHGTQVHATAVIGRARVTAGALEGARTPGAGAREGAATSAS